MKARLAWRTRWRASGSRASTVARKPMPSAIVHQSSGERRGWEPDCGITLGAGRPASAKRALSACGSVMRSPRVEATVEVGLLFADGIPEGGAHGFDEARAPRGDGEGAAGGDEAPELADGGGDVRYEEDAEDADHGIKAGFR